MSDERKKDVDVFDMDGVGTLKIRYGSNNTASFRLFPSQERISDTISKLKKSTIQERTGKTNK